MGVTSTALAAPFGLEVRSLYRGLSGTDVENLQTLLAQDGDVYPEGLITGFYGALTEIAVKRFQNKHGIEQAGIVGPKTKLKIHLLLSSASGTTTTATSTGFIPPGLAKKLLADFTGAKKGIATSSPELGLVIICHRPPGNPANGHTISIGAPAVKAHLAKGSTVGPCTATTTPPTSDTTAPIISALATSNIGSTTATVTWSTNELADTAMWLSTTSPIVLSAPSLFNSPALGTMHTGNLATLMASTTYYYVVQSKDPAGNAATSSQQSFSTLP